MPLGCLVCRHYDAEERGRNTDILSWKMPCRDCMLRTPALHEGVFYQPKGPEREEADARAADRG